MNSGEMEEELKRLEAKATALMERLQECYGEVDEWRKKVLLLKSLKRTKNRKRITEQIFLYSEVNIMRGRIWLLLQVSSPAALFPRVCWECVKACQTVGDQLIIASYWGPG